MTYNVGRKRAKEDGMCALRNSHLPLRADAATYYVMQTVYIMKSLYQQTAGSEVAHFQTTLNVSFLVHFFMLFINYS